MCLVALLVLLSAYTYPQLKSCNNLLTRPPQAAGITVSPIIISMIISNLVILYWHHTTYMHIYTLAIPIFFCVA